MKQDNYFVLECQAQAFKYWTPYKGQVRLHAYSHLASGADAILYWNWHSIHNGYETYWKGVLSHDLETNPTYEEAGQFGNEVKVHGSKLCHLKKQNKVALVIDNNALTAFEWFPIDRDIAYNDVVRWMYDALYELNIECDVVDAEALEVNNYQMIVTPALYSAKEATMTALDQFVKSGGVLVSSFKSFIADETLSVYPDKQPHLLHECFGMSYNQFTNPSRMKVLGDEVRYFAELLKVEGATSYAQYEHNYWGEYAAITHHTYGAGEAYYIGCYTTKAVLKRILTEAAHKAQLDTYGLLDKGIKWPIIMRSGINEEGKNLHYIFNYSEEGHTLECPVDVARDLLTGKTYHKTDQMILKDWDVIILEDMR